MNARAEIVFKPAVLEAVNLIIGLVAGTGGGKTYSGMRLASGMSRGKRFAVVDTERDRAKHYARDFAFDHHALRAPFRPERYAEAILAADAAGYPVIMVDSASHEWAGEGGILDWHEEELERMSKGDWQKREACKMAAWIKPKMGHKKMVQRLLQVRAHVILCLRAEEKVEMVREDGKMKIVPKVSRTGLDGWIPICEKSLPFELTASFLLTNDAPGVPKPIKLEQQHRALFPLDQPIDEKAGERIAAWAAGTSSPQGQTTTTGSTAPTLAEYESCPTRETFDALEKRRQDGWRTFTTAQKAALKEASDKAKQRLTAPATARPHTADSAIAALRACTDDASRAATWNDINADYEAAGQDVPPEVEHANALVKEQLKL